MARCQFTLSRLILYLAIIAIGMGFHRYSLAKQYSLTANITAATIATLLVLLFVIRWRDWARGIIGTTLGTLCSPPALVAARGRPIPTYRLFGSQVLDCFFTALVCAVLGGITAHLVHMRRAKRFGERDQKRGVAPFLRQDTQNGRP